MMQKYHFLGSILAGIGLLILIFDSRLALEGAGTGIDLCIKTVIPSLFPFFVLSMILTKGLGDCIPDPLQKLGLMLGIPASGISVLIPAFLGGYPVGANCIGDLYRNNHISKEDAQRMLAFCSNAGPSFLFGMVSGFFPEQKTVWLLWMIHICSAVLTASAIPFEKSRDTVQNPSQTSRHADTILPAARAMALVCCWVVLFRVLIAFLDAWFFRRLPVWLQVLLMGALELTNGCCALPMIADANLRFLLCSCMLSFGGICVLFQTASVTKGLSLACYIKGKLMQTLFSFLLSCAIVLDRGWYFAIFLPLCVILFRKAQNRYGNPGILPV